ncbi:MAG: hypothetical protein ABI723_08615 [Bacteroidia bacterium]
MNFLKLIPGIMICALLSSCETNTFLKSKKKLNSELQGYWSPAYGTSQYGTTANNNKVLWYFKDGEVFILRTDDTGNDVSIDNGHYSFQNKLDQDYLTIEDLKSVEYNSMYGFNIKWNLIDLGKNTLDIAGQPHNSGRIEIEFKKTEH